MKKPAPMRSPLEKRKPDKFCPYHRDHGHSTNKCFKLKVTIKNLIEKCQLTDFVD